MIDHFKEPYIGFDITQKRGLDIAPLIKPEPTFKKPRVVYSSEWVPEHKMFEMVPITLYD